MAYYNPYFQQPFFNGYQFPQQTNQQTGIAGKQVHDFSEITANDVPLNGQCAVFPKADLSEIQVKRWGSDGMIVTNTYRPIEPPQTTQAEESSVDLLEVINGRFDELKNLIDGLGKPKTATKKEGKSNE